MPPEPAATEAAKPSTPAPLTTFFIFETTDTVTWRYVGITEARDRDHASRLFYAGSETKEVTHCAVSVHAWKPKVRKPKVVETVDYEDTLMPALGAQETLVLDDTTAEQVLALDPDPLP